MAGPLPGDPIRIDHARHQFNDRGVKCRDAALGLLKPELQFRHCRSQPLRMFEARFQSGVLSLESGDLVVHFGAQGLNEVDIDLVEEGIARNAL